MPGFDPGVFTLPDHTRDVCVVATLLAGASNRVVEIVSNPTAPVLDVAMWFA